MIANKRIYKESCAEIQSRDVVQKLNVIHFAIKTQVSLHALFGNTSLTNTFKMKVMQMTSNSIMNLDMITVHGYLNE